MSSMLLEAIYCCLIGLVIGLVYLIVAPLLSPLKSIPGPLPARFSRLWYLYRVWKGRFDVDLLGAHRTYGSVVRCAPNLYCFNDPEAVGQIYGKGFELDKSDWYEAWNAPGFKTMFTEPSVKAHGQLRRKFQAAFTMSSMVSYETYVDNCIEILKDRFEDIAKAGRTVDLANWLLSYAGDAISMMTYSRRMGFLDRGEDVGDFFATMHSNALYSTLVGIYSEVHSIIFTVSAWASRLGLTGGTPRMFISQFNSKPIAEKRRQRESMEERKSPIEGEEETSPKDFLTKFLDKHDEDSTKFTERDINIGLVGNIIAGSDTTAAALTAIMYCLLKNPASLLELRKELASAAASGALSSPPAYKEANELRYLQAVVQEAMRMHPPVGLPLQRVIPPEGREICGYSFPGGSVVGVSALAIHMNPAIFGHDAACFRPQRWLETDKEKMALMQRYWMPFGLGSRTCVGKNISLLEITKLIPELVRNFEFELMAGLQDSGKEMQWFNMWFVRPVALPVRISIRLKS